MRYARDCVKAEGEDDGLRSETRVDVVAQLHGKRKERHFLAGCGPIRSS